MQAEQLFQHISVPDQTLKKLSFCAGNKPSKVSEWVGLLRPSQVEKTSSLLYSALPEIVQLKASPAARFELLEILRPHVQNTIQQLSKYYLHQPISLAEGAQKSVVLSLALQKQMIDGYCICARDFFVKVRKKNKVPEAAAVSLHRAMTGLGLLLLRSQQIYSSAPAGLWETLHTLFRITDLYDLEEKRVTDEIQALHKVSAIQSHYWASLMLSCAKPQQLGQNEMATLYEAFIEWSDLLKFELALSSSPDNFYYVNLEKDAAPNYKSRMQEGEENQLLIELNFQPLVAQLSKHTRHNDEPENSSINIPRGMSFAAVNHILEAWSNIGQRRQERRQVKLTADFCVGLSNCHFYLADTESFDTFLRSKNSTEDSLNIGGGFTPVESVGKNAQSHDQNTYRAEVQNVSNGGYCLAWQKNQPVKVEAGEIVCIKEFGKKHWMIGVVRWIRQRKQSSQIGIQIITERARPYAIAQIYDMGGESKFSRALFVPASEFGDVSASIITPTIPFKENDRVKILDGTQNRLCKLDNKIFSTGSMQQFRFHPIETSPKQSTKGESW